MRKKFQVQQYKIQICTCMKNQVLISKLQVGLVIKAYVLHLAHLKDLKTSNVKHTNEEGTSVLKVLSESTHRVVFN